MRNKNLLRQIQTERIHCLQTCLASHVKRFFSGRKNVSEVRILDQQNKKNKNRERIAANKIIYFIILVALKDNSSHVKINKDNKYKMITTFKVN